MSSRCGRQPLAEALTRRKEWVTPSPTRAPPQSTYSIIDTLSGLDGKIHQATRRTEERSPPHLPLPPPLPYAPTSTPFLRHVQILEESLLSACPRASWNIFKALHEDLRKTHLPPDTLRALLSKQIGRIDDSNGGAYVRWNNVVQVLEILGRMGVRGNREDLETTILKAIGVRGIRISKILNHDTLLSIWNALSEAHNGRLQNISAQARERWLLYRFMKVCRHTRQKQSESHALEVLREEWRQLASQGFFQHITLPVYVITVLHDECYRHLRDIMETMRVIHESGGIIPLGALRSIWRNHLELRLVDFDTPDIQTYQYMNQLVETNSTVYMDSFDTLVRDALRDTIIDHTGGVKATSLLLYLPFENSSNTPHLRGDSQPSYEKALNTARRRIKYIPTYPTEDQAPHIVTALGFGAVVVKDAINQGEIISDYVVVTVFRGFKYLPEWLRTDERYARRIESALLLLVRSLRSQDKTMKQWQSTWPTILETLGSYSSTKEIMSQSMLLYRQMRTAKSTDYTDILSAFRRDQFRTSPWRDEPRRKTLDRPWLTMELYVDAVRAGERELDGIRNAIVHRLSDMQNPVYLRHLRIAATRYRNSDEVRYIVLDSLHDAIDLCQSSELVMGLYEIASGISLPKDSASVKILHLLVRKMKELGDEVHRQFAISRVEAEWERGVKLSRSGMETLVLLVDGVHQGKSMEARVEALEDALATKQRLGNTV
ncbi:hypothetical protein QFC22_003236 [Naganishia vaughanmartiniae]|uniref:Uncharacterized protein n=1 Tax=Naganishia vaughanmartiniae TaxID=1424756 RepID=A0ACC2X6J6_9TREE|nr:hypothetical protein QFC22_003236 [Naganishia vaughanmartiniae]